VATTENEFDWDPFIGRSIAYLCLHLADMRSKTTLEQAEFLMQLGLPRKEAAVVVGSSDESLRVMARQKAKRRASVGKGAK
jgi:SAM-dependent MidA family methyltransferase